MGQRRELHSSHLALTGLSWARTGIEEVESVVSCRSDPSQLSVTAESVSSAAVTSITACACVCEVWRCLNTGAYCLQFWRLESEIQAWAGLVPLLGVWMAVFSLCLHVVFPLSCVCLLISPSYKVSSSCGIRTHPRDLILT